MWKEGTFSDAKCARCNRDMTKMTAEEEKTFQTMVAEFGLTAEQKDRMAEFIDEVSTNAFSRGVTAESFSRA